MGRNSLTLPDQSPIATAIETPSPPPTDIRDANGGHKLLHCVPTKRPSDAPIVVFPGAFHELVGRLDGGQEVPFRRVSAGPEHSLSPVVDAKLGLLL